MKLLLRFVVVVLSQCITLNVPFAGEILVVRLRYLLDQLLPLYFVISIFGFNLSSMTALLFLSLLLRCMLENFGSHSYRGSLANNLTLFDDTPGWEMGRPLQLLA